MIKDKADKGFAIPTSNYKFFVLGIVLIVLGFALMVGGASDDPNVFNEEVFSTRRITIAPIVVIIGFIVNGFAIMYRPKN
jgi:Ca2+/H+ antiporter